ncbi:STAS domain-containing protein [Streptomyces sp. NPDC047804]|uniref:STAS domain-containing protein n=1 Tax=Streptomyces TaxID=1883 RepID=UPI0033F173AD
MTKHRGPSFAVPAWLAVTRFGSDRHGRPYSVAATRSCDRRSRRTAPEPAGVEPVFRFRRPLARRSRTTNVIRLRGDISGRQAGSIRARAAEVLGGTFPRYLEDSLAEVVALNTASLNALLVTVVAARERGVAVMILHTGDQARPQLRRSGLGPWVEYSGHKPRENGR